MKITHLISAATLAALGLACGATNKAPASSTTTTTNSNSTYVNMSKPHPVNDPSQPPPTVNDVNDATGTGKTRPAERRRGATPSGAEPVSPGAIR